MQACGAVGCPCRVCARVVPNTHSGPLLTLFLSASYTECNPEKENSDCGQLITEPGLGGVQGEQQTDIPTCRLSPRWMLGRALRPAWKRGFNSPPHPAPVILIMGNAKVFKRKHFLYHFLYYLKSQTIKPNSKQLWGC